MVPSRGLTCGSFTGSETMVRCSLEDYIGLMVLVHEVPDEVRRETVVNVASWVLNMSPDEVREHPGTWGAFHSGDMVDNDLLRFIDWTSLELRLPNTTEWETFGTRTDVDLGRSLIQGLREKSELRDGFIGVQIQSHYLNGRAFLDEFETPVIEARLQSRGDTLVDAMEALLGLRDPQRMLHRARCPQRSCGWLLSEEPSRARWRTLLRRGSTTGASRVFPDADGEGWACAAAARPNTRRTAPPDLGPMSL